jgi:hypothetical protein
VWNILGKFILLWHDFYPHFIFRKLKLKRGHIVSSGQSQDSNPCLFSSLHAWPVCWIQREVEWFVQNNLATRNWFWPLSSVSSCVIHISVYKHLLKTPYLEHSLCEEERCTVFNFKELQWTFKRMLPAREWVQSPAVSVNKL